MATTNASSKIKEIAVVQKTIRVDNSLDADRQFIIRADLSVSNGKLSSINSGEALSNGNNSQQVATFSKYQGGGLNIQFLPSTYAMSAILAAIDDFNAESEEFVKD